MRLQPNVQSAFLAEQYIFPFPPADWVEELRTLLGEMRHHRDSHLAPSSSLTSEPQSTHPMHSSSWWTKYVTTQPESLVSSILSKSLSSVSLPRPLSSTLQVLVLLVSPPLDTMLCACWESNSANCLGFEKFK